MPRSRVLVVAACIGLAAAGAFAHAARNWASAGAVPDIPAVQRVYAPQKVVYHVTGGGGWTGEPHRRVLQTLQSHIGAVGAQRLTVRVILQGEGVDLLARARDDEAMRRTVNFLRANGVRFLVCRSTLVARKIAPETLHGFQRADLAPDGVAEAAALMQEGFVYLKM